MNAGGGAGRLIKERQGAREVEIGILRNKARDRRARERLRDQNRRRLGLFDLGRVFRVGQKGQMTGAGVLHARDAGDLDFSVAFEAASERGGDFTESHQNSA